ncbi:MAG: hypothetical protein PVG22_05115 [Chromatiales bacterium]|jgi:hypothetical protein
MEAEIAQGKNPYADLITLSKGNDWKLQTETQFPRNNLRLVFKLASN